MVIKNVSVYLSPVVCVCFICLPITLKFITCSSPYNNFQDYSIKISQECCVLYDSHIYMYCVASVMVT